MTRRLREVPARYDVMAPVSGDLLLDTHAALWWFVDSPQLTQAVRELIGDSARRVVFSAASAWELATKARIGKLPEMPEVPTRLPGFVQGSRFEVLPISLEHSLLAGALPGPHRDPFDRMLIAQARREGLTVVTRDKIFADYGCTTVW